MGERVQETVDTPSTALSPAIASYPVVETLRASANSRLVINFTPKESLSEGELRELQADRTLSRLRGDRTFVLDGNGVLSQRFRRSVVDAVLRIHWLIRINDG